jgi:PAS domain S-box-containing protein
MRDTANQDADETGEQLSQEETALRRRAAEPEAPESRPDAMAEAPRNPETQYRATLDAMSDMIHVVDDKLQIILANDALRAKNAELGLPTDVVGRTIYDLYPFLSPKVYAEYAEVFERGQLLVTEESTLVGDREVITETRKIPIQAGGRVSHVITVIRDITQRKRAEEEIRRLNQFLDSVIDNANIWLDVLNEKADVVIWNKAAEEISGYSRAEVVGHGQIWQWLYPDEGYRNLILAEARVVIEKGGDEQDAETIIRRKDGQTRIISWNSRGLVDEKGAPIGSIALGRDITERKQAEEEIHQQAETLAALHETALDLAAQRSLPDLLRAIVIRAMALLKASGGGFYLYREGSDDLELAISVNLEPDFTGAVLQRGEGLSGKILASRRPLAVANYRRWEGMSEQYADSNVTAVVGVPIMWSDRLLGVVNVVDDVPRSFSADDIALLERFAPLAAAALENSRLVHDMQQQMEQLKATEAHLVQAAKLAAVGELAAGVAHELNNPLTSILGFTELLLHASPADDRSRGDLETVAKQARRARDIVRGLLGFARQTKPQRQPADVGELLRQTLDLIRQHLEGSGVVIEEEYAPDIGLLALDSGQMKQVFLNLITNAAQAMPRGGKLSLRTARLGDEVAITVSDTGQGIEPGIGDRIFEPFFTTKPAGQGTGLGLSISLGFVQEHGGRISVDSQVGQGSTFTVWLPADR